MIFRTPADVAALPRELPDTVSVGDFVLAGVQAWTSAPDVSRPALVCALTGTTYTVRDLEHRVDCLARSLSIELGWTPNEGSRGEKVAGIFSVNTLDFVVLCWAIHRLGGVCLLLHATNTATEVEQHMLQAQCRVLFSCEPLMSVSEEARLRLGLARENIYLLDVPPPLRTNHEGMTGMKTIEQLVATGMNLPSLEPLQWEPGRGVTEVAYLCATSGTSGVQKLAKATHQNVIANVVQSVSFENTTKHGRTEVGLGIMPLTHNYGLTLQHLMIWRGDTMVLHPKFDMQLVLKSIQQYRIERLYLVPPIITALAMNAVLHKMYDLSSVNSIVTGAAPFSKDILGKLHDLQPNWVLLQGYGLTESGGIVTYSRVNDIVAGSSGSLLPLCEVKLIDETGLEIDELGRAGEICIKSPSVIPGYLSDNEADDRQLFLSKDWIRSGDIGMFLKSPQDIEHLFVVDRAKDMIKVKGMQVAPAELEAHLLIHPAVSDAAVVGVPNLRAGERPHAWVVRSQTSMQSDSAESIKESINEHIEKRFHESHWLGNRITFVDQIPKSQSGKILKKDMRNSLLSSNGSTQTS